MLKFTVTIEDEHGHLVQLEHRQAGGLIKDSFGSMEQSVEDFKCDILPRMMMQYMDQAQEDLKKQKSENDVVFVG